jgi:hypothetical protein
VISRAYGGHLRGRELHIVTPEDFVLMKILSTRERDLEDAAVVLSALSGRLDRSFMAGEIQRLSQEIAGHDVTGRYRRVVGDAP